MRIKGLRDSPECELHFVEEAIRASSMRRQIMRKRGTISETDRPSKVFRELVKNMGISGMT
jgi:hypothetical protein